MMTNKFKLLFKYYKLKLKRALTPSSEWWNWKTFQIGKVVFCFDQQWRYVTWIIVEEPFILGTSPKNPEFFLVYDKNSKSIVKFGQKSGGQE